MSAPTLAERTARGVIAGMIAAAAAATVVGFWLSYAGLHSFALHAGLRGPEAWAWPSSVDLFILAGEAGVTIGALRGRRLTEEWAPWFYLALGFGASVTANVLHVDTAALGWIRYAAAAVPPVAAMLALAALLRQVYAWAETSAERARPSSHRRAASSPSPEPATAPAPRPRPVRSGSASGRPLFPLPPNPPPELIAAAAAMVDPPVNGRKLAELTGRSERTGRRWLEQAELVPAID